MASVLGLASETGSILDSYKRYLRDSIDLDLNRDFLRLELGDLLWYVTLVCSACNLDLASVAKACLHNARERCAKARPKARIIGCHITSDLERHGQIGKAFAVFQFTASQYHQRQIGGPMEPFGPLCGLAAAVGQILGGPKNASGAFDFSAQKGFFKTELADLLWYLTAVATASNLNLGDIAEGNLKRAGSLYPDSTRSLRERLRSLPTLDDPRLPQECFPRKMVVWFEETVTDGHPTATQTVVYAGPHEFPNGPEKIDDDKFQGFGLNEPLGDDTDDNSRRADGYRYHDAIHLGFMAILGWSPTMRKLLQLKRRSKGETDRTEDGARAIFTEEGISAVLARLAPRRMNFQGENTVDGELIDTVRALVRDTEVETIPGWAWRRAISQGFIAMLSLGHNKGGYLTVDLNARALTYSKVIPDVTAWNCN